MSSTRSLLRPFVERELAASKEARARGDRAAAWISLERAHVLSQPAAWLHTRVHWRMLMLGARYRDVREVWGQMIRIAVAGVGSVLGRFPAGNNGRARVSLVQNAPIPEDIARVFAELGITIDGTTVWH